MFLYVQYIIKKSLFLYICPPHPELYYLHLMLYDYNLIQCESHYAIFN